MLIDCIALLVALEIRAGAASWPGRFGAASAVAALALYGGLRAVDGVANKQADVAWLGAPAAEKAARFASAEAVRWAEWGLRSYHDFALGLAVLLFAVAVARTAGIPRPIASTVPAASSAPFTRCFMPSSYSLNPLRYPSHGPSCDAKQRDI